MTKKAFDKISEGLKEVLHITRLDRVSGSVTYDHQASEFLKHFRRFTTEQFGERCPDKEPGCPCCDMWALYDATAARVS